MQYTTKYTSPLGNITLASDGGALTGLWFDGQKYYPRGLDSAAEYGSLPIFRQAADWLDIYFSGKEPDFTPPLLFTGTDFQNEVWSILTSIPYGSTRSYQDVANELARRRGIPRMSAQAAGSAVGRNRLSVIVPCHRVVGTNGSLTGYAGGINRKIGLLKLEGALKDSFFVPEHSTAP